MKILTANIALGLRNMDRLTTNVRGVAAYHSLSSFLVAIFCPPLRGHWGGPPRSLKRVEYLQQHENLDATIRLISEADPDILILNEVVPEIHRSRLDHSLKEMGFVAIVYGLGDKYPDAHVSTLVAVKQEADVILAAMPQLPYPGCGGGIAGLRLKNGMSVIGAHMALAGTDLWCQQLAAIATLVGDEKGLGNRAIFAGDCNETEEPINHSFSKLGLVSVDVHNTSTCPTSLPRIFRKSLDHIYVSNTWKIEDLRAIPFGSDHLALCAEVSI
jgi:endonuclease/exonuclease/phosphatase family metal-dependent hydrolase